MNDIKGYYSVSVFPGQVNIVYNSLNPSRRSYNQYLVDEETGNLVRFRPVQFRNNSHHGKISKVAQRKIARAVSCLAYAVPKKKYYHPGHGRPGEFILNFLTLTLSSKQIHSDNEIKSHLLEPFLNSCRQKWKVISYIWRTEKQANGSLHFHIITDRFIPWNELRNVWNMHQQKLGYVTRYRDNQRLWHQDGFRYRPELEKQWSKSKQFQAYQDGIRHDWNSPNSTDVHSLKSVHNVRAYILKYLEKCEQSESVQGRLWGCSSNLVKLRGGLSAIYYELSDELNRFYEDKSVNSFKQDYVNCLFCPDKLICQSKYPILFEILYSFISKTFPMYRPPGLY